MKLERIPEYATVALVTLIGMGFALYCGKLTGGGQTNTVIGLFGLIAVAIVVLQMKARIWLFIPLCWPLVGQLGSAPGHLPVRDLVVLLVFVVFLALKALKVIRVKPTFSLIDFLLIINLMYVLSVYIRNPVGVEAFGAEKVGGRPYVEIIFAIIAYWVLIRVRFDEDTVGKLPLVMIGGDFVGGVIGFITYHFPSTVPVIMKFYTGVDATTFSAQEGITLGVDEVEREQYLAPVGMSIFRWLCSICVPSTLLNPAYFWRFLLTVLSIFFVMKSGHRLTVPNFAVMFLLACYFRKGISEVLKFASIGAPALALICFLQGNILQLPLPAQRALSFLPGKWDPVAVEAAQDSSKWRYEMWAEVLKTDKYITNKMFGDGFGFTRQQLHEMETSNDTQENFMVSGDYHSGPISTIRDVGYVGLALYYVLMIGMVVQAWKLCGVSKGTPYFNLALFVCIPAIYVPFSFTLLSGGYNSAIPDALYSIAWMKAIEASLAAWRLKQPKSEPTSEASQNISRPELGRGGMMGRPASVRA